MIFENDPTPYLPGLEPAAAAVPPPPATLEGLCVRIRANPARTESWKQAALSCLGKLGWMLATEAARRANRFTCLDAREVRLSDIPCAVAHVNAGLPPWSRARTGLQRGSYNNVVSYYRQAMVDLGLAEPYKCPPPPPRSDWGRFLAAFEREATLPVVRLARWAYPRGIPPEAVFLSHKPAFAAFVRDRVVRPDGAAFVETAFKTLHRLRLSLGMAPLLAARATSNGAAADADALPETVQCEIETIRARMRGTDRDRPRRKSEARMLEEHTIIGYLSWFRRFATYCLAQAADDQPIDVRAWFFGAFIDDYLFSLYDRDRAATAAARGIAKDALPESVGKSSKAAQCGSALMWIARHHFKLDQERLAELEDEISAYRPPRDRSINPKVRAKLDALAEPRARLRLLWLPQKLMRLARAQLESDPVKAAELAMTALAIAIELRCPLRADNLRTLQIGRNVALEHRRGRRLIKFMIEPEAMKNDAAYEWVIGDDTTALFDEYLRRFHPILQAGSRWLFPMGNGEDRPCHLDTLRKHVVRAIDTHVGVEVHLHLFRHFAVCLRLEDGSYTRAELRMLLGHKTFETTERYYAYLQPKLAAARHEAALRRARHGISPEIKRWLREDA